MLREIERHRAQAARRKHLRFALLAAVLLLALCVLSFLPIQDKQALHTKGRLHFWGHGAFFCLLAFFLMRSARTFRAQLAMFLVAAALGWTIEFAQHLAFKESLESFDVMADWCGVIVGTVLALFSTRAPNSTANELWTR